LRDANGVFESFRCHTRSRRGPSVSSKRARSHPRSR
jgi:hypothetical protein